MNYIKDRLEDQIKWYDTKAIHHQKLYKWSAKTTIIISSSLTLFTILSLVYPKYANFLLIVDTILSIIIPILIGFEKINKNYENYISYRRTCESLIREKMFYETNTEPYAHNDLLLLIKRCESIMAHENGIWAQINEKKSD